MRTVYTGYPVLPRTTDSAPINKPLFPLYINNIILSSVYVEYHWRTYFHT